MSKVNNDTTACPKCDNVFPAKISACPKCGHELTEEERLAGIKKNNKNLLGCLGILVIAAIAYFAWPQTETPPPSTTPPPSHTPAPIAQPEPAPAPLPALTKQQARDEVQALLSDLDRFRTTSLFKQCIYGCGDKNPARAWNAKREALQGQLEQQRDLPVMLKAAPGYLWSLGMAYGKNNAKDIKDYRGMVEEGLAD